MTTTTCDLCGATIESNLIIVELRDGEHPHNGSPMSKLVDCCHQCAAQLPQLSSPAEFEEMCERFRS